MRDHAGPPSVVCSDAAAKKPVVDYQTILFETVL